MELNIKYEKSKVLQALRYHFISRREIKIMMILVNVFALFAAVLYAFKLISPLPFLIFFHSISRVKVNIRVT